MKLLLVWIGILALAGCATDIADTPNPFPANYHQLVKEYLGETVKDAKIAPPKLATGPSILGDGGFVMPWVVCVRSGGKVTALQIFGGQVRGAWYGLQDGMGGQLDAGAAACSGAKYE
jgi:hypothetical protein